MDIIRFLNLRYFFNKIYEIFTGASGSGAEGLSFFERLKLLWELGAPYIETLSIYLSLLFIVFFIYSYIRLQQVKAEEEKALKERYLPREEDKKKNEEWEKITALLESQNPNDWRQTVILADIMLDKLVTTQGYGGETLGEKLKSIDPADFLTLNSAWEAHKIRNRIAHDGGDFVLTGREAKRAVGLFGEVFREFGII
ncbi:hypothetical protein COV42_02515 [Candidatus Campbellbacteria bacterium CG11_big_fil_rev_8_21_14_0_20_44_21]|uniref:Uncharacterized protein n=1 Tax=Candidatus Campbellbacteria bacterium CG22_combo_CG10-13_8_21_14_all_43_18 TaxID=1974530 RepID=A0A2H0DXH1_9BACT|nr:MAG: hypothetical protein COW82_00590 [Candidatus Campbellbacteria bacterium CG22_combo_CG10-13_8_21_14_all_43_18]PIR24093.1 MAG: hypothetical protein COV42_02515 [Candidatus Campbellbacteria bacterium CG11_big_fil_rev_8_21_14_0_20_44_21]